MDRSLLEYSIRKNAFSKRDFAKSINFTESRLWRKIAGKSQFTVDEAAEIAEKLNLDKETAYDIFLKKKN